MKKGICKFFSMLIAALLSVSMLVMPAAAEGQAIDSASLNRLNVMLVIDGSGSLVSRNGATDPQGLRYDAIELFMALLTNEGNNVGAIVFDTDFLLESDPGKISGKADKQALTGQIRSAGTRADTDIGSALLAAVEKLQVKTQQNGMDSVVVLFSDGRTDLGNNEEAYKESIENKALAITKAQEAHIPVYSICLAATSVADPDELKEISDRTSGQFVAVSSAEDLTKAFETFYGLIFSSSCENTVTDQFSQDGTVEYRFNVPSYGAEEVNIILDTNDVREIELTAPSGIMSEPEIEDCSMDGGNYRIVKLTDPEKGSWNLRLKGTPNSGVTINVLYNIDSTAVLSAEEGRSDYTAGEPISLRLNLKQSGQMVTDASVTEEYKAVLCITNLSTGEQRTEAMTPTGDGAFGYTLDGKDYTSYRMDAVLSNGNLEIPSNEIRINIGNSAPVADPAEKTEKVIVTPITGRQKTYDLSTYFKDAQDEMLTYHVESSQLVADTVQIEGTKLTVHTSRSHSGDLIISAADSQGATGSMTIHFKVTNLSMPIFIAIVVGLLVLLIVLIMGWYLSRPVFKNMLYVANVNSDPDQLCRSHASFRGKLKLRSFMVGGCGFNPDKCYFEPARGGRLEFHMPKGQKAYINGMPQTVVSLFVGSTVEIYADEEQTRGIRVTVRMNGM